MGLLRDAASLGGLASVFGLAVPPGSEALRHLPASRGCPVLTAGQGTLSRSQSMSFLHEIMPSSGSDVLHRHLGLYALSDCPLVTGNAASLLIDGPATHRAMFAAIAAARDHINRESYLIEDDEVGHRLAQVLIDKQGQGVQVNLIYDSVGSLRTSRSYFQRLRDSGIPVCEFNPVSPWKAKHWRLNHRDHRKILVVDGNIAFTGGLNIRHSPQSSRVRGAPVRILDIEGSGTCDG